MGDLFSEYMTPAEFAGLDSDAQFAVWAAHAEGRIDAARYGPAGTVYVYNRAQVAGLLRGTLADGMAEHQRVVHETGARRTCYCGVTAVVVPGVFPHSDCDGSVEADGV